MFEYLGIREDLDGRTGLYFLFVVRGYVEMPDLKHAATWLKNNFVGRSVLCRPVDARHFSSHRLCPYVDPSADM